MNNRLYSLDIFRGATVALMILVNNPGSWSYIFSPLEHAAWQGCTPTDLVFPFFLFAVGNAMAFVIPGLQTKGYAIFYKKIIKRSIIIFTIGLLLNWLPFFYWHNNILEFKSWSFMNTDSNGNPFEDGVRIMGVLQRIAICYFIASIFAFYFDVKKVIYISIGILLGYWFLTWFLGTSDPYCLTGFFGNNIDISILSKHHILHIDKVNDKIFHFDYEGIISTTAAIVQVLLGYLVGNFIIKKGKTFEMITQLFVLATILLLIGYCWDFVFPISKKMWTSSYTVYTSGLATATIAFLVYFIEMKNYKNNITKFFDVFGKNPLFIFVLSGFLPRVLSLIRINDVDDTGNPIFLTPLSWFYHHICKNISTDLRVGSLLYAVILIFFYWAICYILDKKKIYIKV
jgi:predicted acyltransferase